MKVGAFAAWDIAQHPPGPRARSILICRARRDERGRGDGRDGGRHARTNPKVYLRPRGFPDFTPHPPPPPAIPRAQPAAQYVCVALGGIRPAIRHPAALATKFVTRPLLCRPPPAGIARPHRRQHLRLCTASPRIWLPMVESTPVMAHGAKTHVELVQEAVLPTLLLLNLLHLKPSLRRE